MGCAVGGGLLAWKLAQTDGPLIVEIGAVIGSTSGSGQRVAGALLGREVLQLGRWEMTEVESRLEIECDAAQSVSSGDRRVACKQESNWLRARRQQVVPG